MESTPFQRAESIGASADYAKNPGFSHESLDDADANAEPAEFRTVYDAEQESIARRRNALHGEYDRTDCAGLALSGGGIRSATFSLGVLQALQKRGLLMKFDYMSTVSGGGFTGSWWIAWLTRVSTQGNSSSPVIDPEDSRASLLFPRSEVIEPRRGTLREIKGRESAGSHNGETAIPEGSVSAGLDPIHHLRLFSNYLTPVKGIFSSDVWRAVTVIGRNLILTWGALIPLLLAAVLFAQLYFALIPRSSEQFFYPYHENLEHRQFLATRDSLLDDGATAYGIYDETDQPLTPELLARIEAADAFESQGWQSRTSRLFDSSHAFFIKHRLVYILAPVFILVSWIGFLVALWLQNLNVDRMQSARIQLFWALAFSGALLTSWLWCFTLIGVSFKAALLHLVLRHPPVLATYAIAWLLGTIWLVRAVGGFMTEPVRRNSSSNQVFRNTLTRYQSILAIAVFGIASLLLFGGFGHELVNFVIHETAPGSMLAGRIAKAGGWGAALLSVVGALYTALRVAPRGGDEQKSSTSKLDKILFSLSPHLFLFVLLCVLSWVGHMWTAVLLYHAERTEVILSGALILNALSLMYAIGDMAFRGANANGTRSQRILHTGICGLLFIMGFYVSAFTDHSWGAITILTAFTLLLALRLRKQRQFDLKAGIRPPLRLWSLVGAAALVSALVSGVCISHLTTLIDKSDYATAAYAAMLAITSGLIVVEIVWGKSSGIYGAGLASLVAIALAYVMLAPAIHQAYELDLLVGRNVAILLSYCIGCVVLIGWTADPNAISIHAFYKSRLVRAYLGASNRKRVHRMITEAEQGDDLPLAECDSTEIGGPYPIINTTLNLVGAKDLASVQRKAAPFVMTPKYCGSLGTRYRPTSKYMGGLSLGTVAAISGAAASPNMGSKSVSSSLGVLLSLLNVRLGLWAATPNRQQWRMRQARPWPYYLIRETVSETTQLDDFCYLTDGGHFENTGIYSLIERGCKFILASDNGADPDYSFDDLSNAIRRCRIDFGTEFRVPGIVGYLDAASRIGEGLITGEYFLSESHVKTLWPREYAQVRSDPVKLRELQRGVIVVIKPHVRRDTCADVIQYSKNNKEFPQQSTAEQWFSEDRFESYRKLGEESFARCADRDCEAVWGRELLKAFTERTPPNSALTDLPRYERSAISTASTVPAMGYE